MNDIGHNNLRHHGRLHNDIAAADPYLTLPLDGVHLIEASAGTGKTFTLATLVTRLVVERGLRVGQVLAVTFTDAATQELRSRIRERLALAARIAAGEPCDEDAAATTSQAIVDRQLATGVETRDQLARRLHAAALEIDLAAIFTIHGFCARVLREHALACGQDFDPPTQLTSDANLREQLAADLWRSAAADADSAALLPLLWRSPELLARDLRALLAHDRLLPEPTAPGNDPRPTLEAAARTLHAAVADHGHSLRAELEAAVVGGLINKAMYKADVLDPHWDALHRWCDAGVASAVFDDKLSRFGTTVLLAKTNKAGQGRTPQSPLCGAIDGFLHERARYQSWLDAHAATLLHHLRTQARERLSEHKRVLRLQTYDDLIDNVADALDGPGGDALAAALRAQYRYALVDEFQDTDPRQWAIFRRVFGQPQDDAAESPALLLIGDPKQAIYGFRGGDVHTYLQAQADAASAPALDRNFRSRPRVLNAIAQLYANATRAGDVPFLDPRIAFEPVQPGGRRNDEAFLRDGVPAPGLHVRTLDLDPDAPESSHFDAERSRALATRACVADIHALLRDARAGRASIDGRPVVPGDIAVLVRKHHEATRIQHALSAAGIAAVAAGRQSLYASDEARDLLALFEALLQPADDGRLRAALASVLLGLDAAALATLDIDPDAHAGYQRQAQDWRERWQRSGPLALMSDLCAAQAERLLGLLDGERRLTNYLQLGERMQEAQAHTPGLHAQLDALRLAIADADADDEAQLLRLESDADRVQIVTLHKSKGLEYPLVYLPFAGIGSRDKPPERHCIVHDGDARVLRWKIDKHDPAWLQAVQDFKQEQRAEDARLLYVGLTRARHALWLATGAFYNAGSTRLAPMLADRAALHACADIVIDDSPLPPPPPPLPPLPEAALSDARIAGRVLSRDWWVYSFTQLIKAGTGERETTHAIATTSGGGAQDEPVADAGVLETTAAAFDPRFAGSRFGDVLHDAFEHVEFGAWRHWRAGAAPDGEAAHLRAALQRGGYAARDLDDGIAALTPLIGHGLTVVLPEHVRLCDLPNDARRAEMEFHFALQPTTVEALLTLLHRFGVLRERHGFGARRALEGLMTGKIDLTYTAGGRWYLLDYKSNRLPGYDPAVLDAAMAHSGYDLQALIYTLALHRWLRFRLGADYDYARDFGGVRYLFCRGLAAGGGVRAHTPAPELVHALDALFGGAAA